VHEGVHLLQGLLIWMQSLTLCAVAAQIFLLDTQEQDRARADGQAWKEDAQWARILDQGWDLGRVRQAGGLPPPPSSVPQMTKSSRLPFSLFEFFRHHNPRSTCV
jgi:hypothetical protein